MPTDDYIPRKDGEFRDWARAFAQIISDDWSTYGLTIAQAASIYQVADDYIQKYELATNGLTRNKQTIADKDDARSAAESLLRNYAMLIRENRGVTDGDKLVIGIRPLNPIRTRRWCPQTVPNLKVLSQTPGVQTLEFSDPTQPRSHAKPFSATELQLFLAITDGPGSAPRDLARFHRKITRNPIRVEFRPEHNQKLATYYARWADRRGETGPWSQPVSMSIAAPGGKNSNEPKPAMDPKQLDLFPLE